MTQFSIKLRIKLIFFYMLFLFCLGCDKDCTTCPEKPKDSISDYNIYIGLFGGNGGIYIYNTKAMAVVDSILGVPSHNSIEVTAGEEYLIGTDLTGPGGTWIMDLNTKQIIKELSYSGKIEISSNGKYVAIQSQQVKFLDASTFDEILTDSISVYGGKFDKSGNIFYALKAGDTLVRYDLTGSAAFQDFPLELTGLSYSHVRGVVPSFDTNKIFINVLIGTMWSGIYAYFLNDDSTKGLYWVESENSDMELTPNGQKLIFTEPFNFLNTSPANVYIADAEQNHTYAIIPPPFIADPYWQNLMNSSEIAITPDGKYCIFGSGAVQWQGVLSIESREYIDWFRLDSSGSGAYGRTVACKKWAN